jgi:hypothetical protein
MNFYFIYLEQQKDRTIIFDVYMNAIKLTTLSRPMPLAKSAGGIGEIGGNFLYIL